MDQIDASRKPQSSSRDVRLPKAKSAKQSKNIIIEQRNKEPDSRQTKAKKKSYANRKSNQSKRCKISHAKQNLTKIKQTLLEKGKRSNDKGKQKKQKKPEHTLLRNGENDAYSSLCTSASFPTAKYQTSPRIDGGTLHCARK